MDTGAAREKRLSKRRRNWALALSFVLILISLPLFQFALSIKKDEDNPYTRIGYDKIVRLALVASSKNRATFSRAIATMWTAGFELDRKRLQRAEMLYLSALDQLKQYPGLDNALAQNCCFRLGKVLEDESKYGEAETQYKQAIECAKRTFGEEHQKVADGMRSLAFCLAREQRYDEAKELYQKALAQDKKGLGEDDLDVAYDMSCIGEMCYRTNLYDEAVQWFRKSLIVWEKQRGANHPSFAWVSENLARSLYMAGRFAEAADVFSKLAESSQLNFGGGHKDHLRLLAWLGWSCVSAGKRDEAIKVVARLQKALESKDYPDRVKMTATFESAGDLALLLNEFAIAESIYTSLLEGQQREYGMRDARLCKTLTAICECRARLGKKLEGQDYYERARSLCELKGNEAFMLKLNALQLGHTSSGATNLSGQAASSSGVAASQQSTDAPR
ncbi:MAG TPA: tetratricopeptide repeat protein [Candidatus Obscuribacterales bacterium]